MIKPSFPAALSCVVVLLASGLAQAQPSTMPDNATQVPPEMGVKPALQGASAPLPADLKPRIRPELKPRMKSDELKPELRSEQRPEMSPGLQPNSQKPLRTDAPTKRAN
ncbi:hypothetical protein [Polaromonas eurypsychrophila]|uniref:Uncharacterized protein n=1 Tax=Polaromonas eurypsychrophila TaxID=1614635 RepID=A0A916S8Z9_9BURK|nr:hypothetical protein [Polaromonas eurypsychrophila]GGA89586.1 hypothetical protein GCM10011496_08010 [Polaromonas eurypsychrophila]